MNTPALEETSDQLAILEDRQPSPESAVWQHNEVAVARYLLTEAEQKLLLYVVAMIAPDATQFSRYRVEVAAYAEACGLSGKSVYETVAASALSIQKQRPLVIMDHPDPQTGELGILSTHWFSEVQLNPGSVTVVFPPSLSRYLVAVKKEFFQYELNIALHFRGEYPARLYQWARSQAFRGRKVLPLAELRALLGLIEWDEKGKPRKYDEKRPAHQRAVARLRRHEKVGTSASPGGNRACLGH